MSWLRIKYTLLALISMGCWLRSSRSDSAWDKILWDMLIAGKIQCVGEFTADIGGYEVWIRNYPYASGRLYNRGGPAGPLCKRSTALFLNSQLPAGRILTGIRFTADQQRYYFSEHDFYEKIQADNIDS